MTQSQTTQAEKEPQKLLNYARDWFENQITDKDFSKNIVAFTRQVHT